MSKTSRRTDSEADDHEDLWVWLQPSRLPRGLSCIVVAVLYILPRSSAVAQPDMLTTL